jgi:hypothetical protein
MSREFQTEKKSPQSQIAAGLLQRRATNENEHEPETVPPIVHEVLRSPGQPFDAEPRAFFEPRLGHDFSHVRVHTDAWAAESAQAVNALAYTVERDVVFGTGQYAPRTIVGKRLLGHELTHVIQQEVSHSPSLQRQRKASAEKASVLKTPAAEEIKPVATKQGQSTPLIGRVESIRAMLIRYYQEADMIQLPKNPLSAASLEMLIPIIGSIMHKFGIPQPDIAIGLLRVMLAREAAIFVAYSKAGVDPMPYFVACLCDMDTAINRFFYQTLTLLANSRGVEQEGAKKNLEDAARFYFSEGVSLLLTYREFLKSVGEIAYKSPFHERMEEIVTIDQAQMYWKDFEACADSIAQTRASINKQAQGL